MVGVAPEGAGALTTMSSAGGTVVVDEVELGGVVVEVVGGVVGAIVGGDVGATVGGIVGAGAGVHFELRYDST